LIYVRDIRHDRREEAWRKPSKVKRRNMISIYLRPMITKNNKKGDIIPKILTIIATTLNLFELTVESKDMIFQHILRYFFYFVYWLIIILHLLSSSSLIWWSRGSSLSGELNDDNAHHGSLQLNTVGDEAFNPCLTYFNDIIIFYATNNCPYH